MLYDTMAALLAGKSLSAKALAGTPLSSRQVRPHAEGTLSVSLHDEPRTCSGYNRFWQQETHQRGFLWVTLRASRTPQRQSSLY